VQGGGTLPLFATFACLSKSHSARIFKHVSSHISARILNSKLLFWPRYDVDASIPTTRTVTRTYISRDLHLTMSCRLVFIYRSKLCHVKRCKQLRTKQRKSLLALINIRHRFERVGSLDNHQLPARYFTFVDSFRRSDSHLLAVLELLF